MKAFTVYQPYAFAIMEGLKRYETRPRRTNIRGRVAVHAGAAGFDAAMKGRSQADKDAISAMQHESPFIENVLARGAVIGTIEIVDSVPVEEVMHTLTERERLLGDYSPGRFAWVLQNPIMFPAPIRARGQQGWWEWRISETTENIILLQAMMKEARENSRRTYWNKRLGGKDGEST